MREAKIKCPQCGASITVREKIADDVWKSFDEVFSKMDKLLKKLFRRKP